MGEAERRDRHAEAPHQPVFPAVRIRSNGDALADPQARAAGLFHRHERGQTAMDGSFSVPSAAFKLRHGGPRIDSAPPTLGQHNDEILAELRDDGVRSVAGMKDD